jgi:hypothetical protein
VLAELPQQKAETVSDDNRTERTDMLKRTAEVIRETAKTNVVGRPMLKPTKQIDDPVKRDRAMENLKAMNDRDQPLPKPHKSSA